MGRGGAARGDLAMRSTSPASPALSSIDAHPKRVATGSKAAGEHWELARRVEPAGLAGALSRRSGIAAGPCGPSRCGQDQNLRKSGWSSCHHTSTTLPTMLEPLTGPQYRLSHESARLSPSM